MKICFVCTKAKFLIIQFCFCCFVFACTIIWAMVFGNLPRACVLSSSVLAFMKICFALNFSLYDGRCELRQSVWSGDNDRKAGQLFWHKSCSSVACYGYWRISIWGTVYQSLSPARYICFLMLSCQNMLYEYWFVQLMTVFDRTIILFFLQEKIFTHDIKWC